MPRTAADTDQWDHQTAAGELADAFYQHDMSYLAGMSSTQRAAQARARQELAEYVDGIWEDLKRRGLRPADHPEEYNAVAAMRDLANALYFGHVTEAQQVASDDDPA